MLDDIYGTFTGYPFELKAKLQNQNKTLQWGIDAAAPRFTLVNIAPLGTLEKSVEKFHIPTG